MSENHGKVVAFVSAFRKQVNRHRLWTTLVWTIVVGAAALVLIGSWYAVTGYAMPGGWIAGVIGVAAAGGFIAWLGRRVSFDRAASLADRFFQLKDTVASYLHFSQKDQQEGYYALQAEQAGSEVGGLDPGSIPYEPPHRGLILAAGLVILAVPLSLRGPTDAIEQQMLLEEVTQQKTIEINEELTDLVEELREEIKDPLEKKLVDPDKLRKWVAELVATKDQKEALRQYARLERKLNEARLATQRKRDQQLLDRAAQQLSKEAQAKSLARSLQQKKYGEAARKLAKMEPKSDKPLSRQRKELARLKAVAQRMAAASRAQSGSAGGSGGSGGKGEGELSQAMEDLAQAVDQLDDSLKEAERQESQLGKCSADKKSDCQSCQKKVSDKLCQLCDALKKHSIRCNADKRLCRLAKKCSSCQGGLCKACATCQSPNAGGKKPGWGSNTARRDQQDELIDNGQTTQLKGIKGSGPSLKSVETAEDGSGVSSRQATNRVRNYQKQYESFVHREDVPEQVKQGVKRYFQVIHNDSSQISDGETAQ